jgi:hypothetical protein
MSKKKTDVNGDLPLVEKVPIDARKALRSAPSLRPGAALIEAAAEGNKHAQAIAASWRFQASRATVIRVVTPHEFQEMAERGHVTFHG